MSDQRREGAHTWVDVADDLARALTGVMRPEREHEEMETARRTLRAYEAARSLRAEPRTTVIKDQANG